MVPYERILWVKEILVIAAEGWEFDGVLRRAGAPRPFHCAVQWSRIVDWLGARWLLAAHGAGPSLARYAARSALEALRASGREASAVISAGLCGALDPALRPGDIFVASSVNGRAASQPAAGLPFHSGPLVSQDRVASSAEEKNRLRTDGACAVEMEAAGVSEAAGNHAFFCIKSVSDAAAETFSIDFNAARDRFGRFLPASIVAQALKNPFRGVPELRRLRANSRIAVDSLGEFLGSCRF